MPTSSQALNLLKQFSCLNHNEHICHTEVTPDFVPLASFPPPCDSYTSSGGGDLDAIPDQSYYCALQESSDGASMKPFQPVIAAPPCSRSMEKDIDKEIQARFRFLTLPPIGTQSEPQHTSILKNGSRFEKTRIDRISTSVPKENGDHPGTKNSEEIEDAEKRGRGNQKRSSSYEGRSSIKRTGPSRVSVIWYNDALRANQRRSESEGKKLRFSTDLSDLNDKVLSAPNFQLKAKQASSSLNSSYEFDIREGDSGDNPDGKHAGENLVPAHQPKSSTVSEEMIKGRDTACQQNTSNFDETTDGLEGTATAVDNHSDKGTEAKKVPLAGSTLNLKVKPKSNKSVEDLRVLDKTSCVGILSYRPDTGRYFWNLQPQQMTSIARQRGWRKRKNLVTAVPYTIRQADSDTSHKVNVIKGQLNYAATVSHSQASVRSNRKVQYYSAIKDDMAGCFKSPRQARFPVSWGGDNVYWYESQSQQTTVDECITFYTDNAADLGTDNPQGDSDDSNLVALKNRQSWPSKDLNVQFIRLPAIAKAMDLNDIGNENRPEAEVEAEAAGERYAQSSIVTPMSICPSVPNETANKLKRLTFSGIINCQDFSFTASRAPRPAYHTIPQAGSEEPRPTKWRRHQVDPKTQLTFTGLTAQQKKAAEQRKKKENSPTDSPAYTKEEQTDVDFASHNPSCDQPIRYTPNLPAVTPPPIQDLRNKTAMTDNVNEQDSGDSEKDDNDDDVNHKIRTSHAARPHYKVTRMRASLPPRKPNRLCFRTSLSGYTHAQVKAEIESQANVKVTWLQYDPISLQTCYDSLDADTEYRCMWMFELENKKDIKRLLADGFALQGLRMNVRLLDEVYDEEFRAFSLCNEIYSEHCSKRLAKAGFRRKMALITK